MLYPKLWTFLGFVVLPLLIFEELAIDVRQKTGFAWDWAILNTIHQTANPTLTWLAEWITPFGVYQGVFPVSVAIAGFLLIQKKRRSLTYWGISLCGSVLLNRVAKELFQRVRPSFWTMLYQADGFAFPSGHAMSSMSFVVTLILLTWGTRWNWLVVILGIGFVLVIAWTRLYLAVHFPSDILAGWMLAIAWAVGVRLLIA